MLILYCGCFSIYVYFFIKSFVLITPIDWKKWDDTNAFLQLFYSWVFIHITKYVINYHTIALSVPLPAVIVSLSVEEHHYKVLHFPPTICTSSRAMSFYSIIVIIDVLVAIGVYLLIIVFWIIKRVILYKHDIDLIIICLEFCIFIKQEAKSEYS